VVPTLSNAPLFNGNISAMTWNNGTAQGDAKQNGYRYTYDAMNRITGADYRQKKSDWAQPTHLDRGRETGQTPGAPLPNGGFDVLAFDDGDIKITEPGFVYIYLSNENENRVEVFFDDFTVEHTKSPVVQQDDYYPFGLTFNSYQREKSSINQYQFNGKESKMNLI
jgi:hypothetical protein